MADRATASDLQKAQIHVLDERGNTDDIVPVLFNPTEYSLSKRIEYSDQRVAGMATPVTQFVSGEAETLSMELFFDTSEERTDVRAHTEEIRDLLEVDGDLHAPPLCRFVWGPLNFKAVLESADTQFTMFLSEGIPVRARMDVIFREHKTPEEQATERKRKSADKTTIRRVRAGDSLWSIAAEEYNHPGKWRHIADANDVETPRELAGGTELVIPPLE
jgi:hypothetical protein